MAQGKALLKKVNRWSEPARLVYSLCSPGIPALPPGAKQQARSVLETKMGRKRKEIILREQANGCIVCISHVRTKGYTMVWNGKKLQPLHRRIWEEKKGEIPRGLDVLHRCDNPSCVNTDHLYLGTHQENMHDRDSKGRTARGERHYMSILKEKDIEVIFRMHSEGIKRKQIADRIGTCPSNITKILCGKSWKHHCFIPGLSPEQRQLVIKAQERYGAIEPCSGKNWGECFMRLPGGELTFWFNSTDGGSHMEREGVRSKSNL